MDPERWQQVARVYEGAADQPPADRRAYLAQACAGDDSLRREVESLLDQDGTPVLIDRPAAEAAAELLAADAALTPGMLLGPYRIDGLIGSGGMGQVYRATDTRLNRTVAIKLLTGASALDPESRERFLREGRAVAALAHPHICTVHDVGQHPVGGSGPLLDFLVMEYVEGDTLSARLEKGALPLDASLTYAIEIASALEKAHREGIVHRDLKPGNIMLTESGAKLLDFGLAKIAASRSSGAVEHQPRGTPLELTSPGTVLGTFQYMSPEQLEGQEADARTDIFAFGTVLYEMLTGARAFQAKSQASLIGAIMHADPPSVSVRQPLSPPALDRVVRTCLAKDPDERWQSAGDLARELRWIAESTPSARTALIPPAPGHRLRWRTALGWAAGSVLLLLALYAVARMRLLPSAVETPVTRFSFSLPQGSSLPAFRSDQQSNTVATLPVAVSHDGRRIAFSAIDLDGRRRIWIRSLDNLEPQAVAGTEGGSDPFWSPDDQFLGFFARESLKKVSPADGAALVLSDAPDAQGGTWSADGRTILFSGAGVIQRVSAAGGVPAPLTRLESDDRAHTRPAFLPDGRRFIYHVLRPGRRSSLVAVSLESGSAQPLMVTDAMNVSYSRGHLLFMRGTSLMAQQFDAARPALIGEPFSVVASIQRPRTSPALGVFSASDGGVLAYEGADGAGISELHWIDRTGRRMGRIGEPGEFTSLSLSPDGRRLAVAAVDGQGATGDIWLYDSMTGRRTRLAIDDTDDPTFVWSPDGTRLVFGSTRTNPPGLIITTADGFSVQHTLPVAVGSGTQSPVQPSHWSPDGSVILASVGTELWMVPVDGTAKPSRWGTHLEGTQSHGQFSPDGRWIAYQSSGRSGTEIYVSSFPTSAGTWQVSTGGGTIPRWRRDGREIFYLAPDGALMAATVKSTGPSLELGDVRPLFRIRRTLLANRFGSPYDVAAGRDFFVFNTVLNEAMPAAITVVLNWTGGFSRD